MCFNIIRSTVPEERIMLHGVRVAVVDDENRLVGSVPVWFMGIGIMSGFLSIASVLFLAVPPFIEVIFGRQVDYTYAIYGVMVLLVSFIFLLWYNEVMDVLLDPYGRIMYPARRIW